MDADRIKGTARTGFGRLQEDYGRLIGDDADVVQGRARQAAGETQNAYGQTRDGLRDALDRASMLADEAYAQGRRRLEQGADVVQAQVDANPVMSILIACAAGYMVGLMFRLSRR